MLARNSPAMSAVYTRAATRSVSNRADLAGIVQVGTGYSVETSRAARDVRGHDDRSGARLRLSRMESSFQAGNPSQDRPPETCLRAGARMLCHDVLGCRLDHPRLRRTAGKVHVAGVGRNHSVDPPADRDWSVPRYLFVGWEWERKNGPGVVRAFERVRREIPTARLALVGRHERIDAPGIEDHGILRLDNPGDRRRVEDLFRSSTCFVMPSQCEPSALAYVEAAHAGLPAIGTTVGGFSDIIRDGGRAVDPFDGQALVDAMLEFADPDVAARAGAIARSRSYLYTWPSVASRLLEHSRLTRALPNWNPSFSARSHAWRGQQPVRDAPVTLGDATLLVALAPFLPTLDVVAATSAGAAPCSRRSLLDVFAPVVRHAIGHAVPVPTGNPRDPVGADTSIQISWTTPHGTLPTQPNIASTSTAPFAPLFTPTAYRVRDYSVARATCSRPCLRCRGSRFGRCGRAQ